LSLLTLVNGNCHYTVRFASFPQKNDHRFHSKILIDRCVIRLSKADRRRMAGKRTFSLLSASNTRAVLLWLLPDSQNILLIYSWLCIKSRTTILCIVLEIWPFDSKFHHRWRPKAGKSIQSRRVFWECR